MKRLVMIGLAIILAIGLALPVMAQGPIEPPEVNITTYPGAEIEQAKVITSPELPLVIDIVLLEDETASFGDDIHYLQVDGGAEAIYDAVMAATPTPDVQFGVAGFRDYPVDPYGSPGDWVYRNLSSLSPAEADWLSGVNALTAGGGNDWPEAQYDAIVAATGDFAWRPEAQKVLIVTTDATFHIPDGTHVNNHASTIAALDDIIVIGLKAPGAGGELDALATDTGGSIQALSSDGTNIADAIFAGLTELTTDVWGVVGDMPSGINVTIDPEVIHDVPGATSVDFTEMITIDPTCEPGIYNVVVSWYANSHPEIEGAYLGDQNINIEVVSLVSVEKHWTHTDVCFAQDDDLDGEFDEDGPIPLDPVPGLDYMVCDEYSLGTPLEALEATIKNNKISNIVPGQFYAVSTVTVVGDLDNLVITEDYSNVLDIAELNPKKGGGKVVVVKMDGEMPCQILDAMDEEVFVDNDDKAVITLGPVSAGDVYMVYVKFQPTLKGMPWIEEPPYQGENINSADAYLDTYHQYDEAVVTIDVVEKVGDD